MNKNEYLNQLSNLLSDLSPSERQDAMLYYEDYINDAGEENESSVLQELGSPVKLATDIKAGLGMNVSLSQASAPKEKDPVKIALWVLLIIVTSPVWLSIVSAVLSGLLAILSTLVGVVIATFAIGISFIVVCLILFVLGIVKLFSLPGCSVLLMGIGLIFGGIGIYSLILCFLLCTKTLPWMFYGSISLCKKCFAKTRKTVTA